MSFKFHKKGLVPVSKAMPGQKPVVKSKAESKPVVDESGQYGPMLVLNPDAQFKFQFGPKKAQMILANISVIQKFAAEYGQKD